MWPFVPKPNSHSLPSEMLQGRKSCMGSKPETVRVAGERGWTVALQLATTLSASLVALTAGW